MNRWRHTRLQPRNLLIQMANSDIKLHFCNYKMGKFVGQDELALGVRRPVSDDQFDLTTFEVFLAQFCSFCPLSFSFFFLLLFCCCCCRFC